MDASLERGANVAWRKSATSCATVACAAVLAVPMAGGVGNRSANTLELNGVLRVVSLRAGECPPATRAGAVCPARSGDGLVRGLGRVTEAYAFIADTTPPTCPSASVRILAYPVRWVVEGKGEIHFALAEHPDCLSDAVAFTAAQSFTVTGGTGLYANATGGGRVERGLTQTDTGARGPETWTGAVSVPGLEFDVTPPVISGARAKTLRVPRKATRVTMTYTVSALDAVDGPVRAACAPASGAKFKVGRTVVRCTATDGSGNSAEASFRVTIKRR